MIGDPRPWGTSGRVTLTRKAGRDVVADVHADGIHVGTVWRKGTTWRALSQARRFNLTELVEYPTANDAIHDVVRRTHPELVEVGA